MRSFLFSGLSRHAVASTSPTSSSSTSSPSHLDSHSYSHSPLHTRSSVKPTSTDTILSKTILAAGTALPRSSSSIVTTTTPKHATSKPDDAAVTVTVKPVRSASSSTCSSSIASVSSASSSEFDAAMVKRGRVKREASSSLSPSNPPSTTTTTTSSPCRPSTPTSPVQIPNKYAGRETAHGAVKRHAAHRRRHPRDVHSPESLSPSLAALLAVTDIPRQTRRRRGSEKPLTVDEIVGDRHISEKELSLTLSGSRGPMDLLLSPPEDLDDYASASESNIGSAMARTTSADSVPSLGDSFVTDMVSSVETPDGSSHRRRLSPMRRSLEPVRSPSDATEEHPLAADGLALDLDDLDLNVFERPADEASKPQFLEPFKPLRSVFKSNLTASLRALRSAAKSFSSINFSSIAADDLLTRSILTIDPNVPYADERRPPVTEEMPSAELRRYLNPTTSSHVDPQPKPSRPFVASIQMQTYKVQRSRSPHSPARGPYPAASPRTASSTTNSTQQQQQQARPGNETPVPGMRQREMRENSDFIRIAVMEMAMRKLGKLDNHQPGRARWALPPRRPSMKPYEIGPNGVPARWTPVTC